MTGIERDGLAWIASWTASPHGPYPAGNPVAQPDLQYVFPAGEAGEQTFRLIVRPDLWGTTFRIHLTNVFGAQALEIDDAYLGVQLDAGVLRAGSNRPVRFEGRSAVRIPPGEGAYSDPIQFDAGEHEAGGKLAVSFHVVGSSGPMTWHAKAIQSSYVTAVGAGSHGAEEDDGAFPFSTTSWYFLDAVDVLAPADTAVIVAFGDSITDGTGSTLNGDDRWPDVLSRRLHVVYGDRVSVVNAGIGGNRILTPIEYSTIAPLGGGPSALSRLDRDVFARPGVAAVVWLEGINDLGGGGATADEVIAGIREGVARLRARGLRVVQATVTSSLGSNNGTPTVDAYRRTVNEFIRTSGIFDAVAEFDTSTLDATTGELRAEFQPNSTTAAVDKIHPNRAGYLAMGHAVPLEPLAPRGGLGG
ncbi:MAG: lysophospholipase [Dehalococcoidia bacterium]|nr:lysophospholipase [Dehalococcoidia bacterium]